MRFALVTCCALLLAPPCLAAVYYVSSQSGDDGNDGLTVGAAFETIDHVNSLALQPGDEVRLLCGETWRVQTLVVTRSGSDGNPIVFSSHPADCADKPVLSGVRAVSGWSMAGVNLYMADLDNGANTGLFPLGVNQLFRGSDRLPFGRWPNIQGHADGGYAEVDDQPEPDQIEDAELPAVNWTGAALHIKGIRWYIMNRFVVSDAGSILTLNDPVTCYAGGCTQWGYFLNNHLATLDLEGEWYWDESTNRVYLYSELGPPTDGEIEGSVITEMDGSLWGAVVLGRNLQEHVRYVTVENLRIERWFDAGITTPINLESDENSHIEILNNDIHDVETTGIRMTTWVWNAAPPNGPSGWRGGRYHRIEGNVVDGANHFGLDTYGTETEILANQIRNVGVIENLGRSGMGCGFTGTNCTENGAGIRIKHSTSAPNHTAQHNTLRLNRLHTIGMNGMDIFGHDMLIENNVIDRACWSKGDCGAIRTFGRDNLSSTPVYDVTIRGNILRDTLGNTDGTHPEFETLFSLAIYLDHYSRDMVVENNTVIGSTWTGILFQNATGSCTGNTLYDNVGANWGSELSVIGSVSQASQSGNILFPLGQNRRSLRVRNETNLTASDHNRLFSPYYDTSIANDDAGCCDMTLGAWQSSTGHDPNSLAHWYNLSPGDPPRSEIFVNDTDQTRDFHLGGVPYQDLDQQPVAGSIQLPAFSSRILIRDAGVVFADGFESGDVTAWSSGQP